MSALSKEKKLELWKEMLRIRLIEQSIIENYPKNEMRCPVHLSIGQEATSVGVCHALEKTDIITASHRCHAPYLAKGGDLKKMIAEIYGKKTGCAGGRGGSMHLFDNDAGVMVSIAIVASSIPLGVGAALKFKMNKEPHVAVCFFGDGAVEEGAFHESANFAATQKLPVLFICENNLYSVYTHLKDRQPDRPLYQLGAAEGLTPYYVATNHVADIYNTTRKALLNVREGHGPAFIQLDTYRYVEHCGPNEDDNLNYRPVTELAYWKKKCPLVIIENDLRAENILNDKIKSSTEHAIREEIEHAYEFARTSPFAENNSASHFLYA